MSDTPATELRKSKKRMTAAERRAQEELEHQRKAADFEQNRKLRWLEVWSKALELTLLLQKVPGATAWADWYFRGFDVNVESRDFEMAAGHYTKTYRDNDLLTYSDVEQALQDLEQGFQIIEDYKAEEERKYQNAMLKATLANTALSKLTPEEREALGLTDSRI